MIARAARAACSEPARRWLAPLCALLATLCLEAASPAAAHASEIDDFQSARAAYDAHDWPRAVLHFEALVGSDPPVLRTPLLINEARKYLAAAYVFVGRRDAARTQFERLLASDPDFDIDPALFPQEVVELFGSVRDALARERQHAAELAAANAALEAERARARALLAIADEEVEARVEASRWIAAVPFGAGQFQNGDEGIGWMFFATETLFGLTSFATLVAHQAILGDFTHADAFRDQAAIDRANQLLLGTEVSSWTSASLFAIFAIAGIVEAQVDFRESRTIQTHHAVPDELREGLEEEAPPAPPAPAVSLGIGGLRLSF